MKLPEGKNRDKTVPYKNNPKVVATNNEATLPMLTTPAWAQSLVYWAAWQAVGQKYPKMVMWLKSVKYLTDNFMAHFMSFQFV